MQVAIIPAMHWSSYLPTYRLCGLRDGSWTACSCPGSLCYLYVLYLYLCMCLLEDVAEEVKEIRCTEACSRLEL